MPILKTFAFIIAAATCCGLFVAAGIFGADLGKAVAVWLVR